MFSRWSVRLLVGVFSLLTGFATAASAQITTGTVTGTVADSQGGMIPGATVVLLSESQGTKLAPQVTNADGIYVFAGVTADTYTVDVTLSGFKEVTRKGLKVVGGDKISVPTIALPTGGINEVVDVKADIPILQAASGERSDVVQTEQLASLPIARAAGTGFRDFANLLPGTAPGGAGAAGQGRIGGGGQDNVMIDGVSVMDTGNNGLMGGLNVSPDSISEVRVETSGYQAEFGRSSGLQVSAVTKSGTNRFHGSMYDIENDSKWNSNTWSNIQNGIAKPRTQSRFLGYTIGGPVGTPGGDNKLFFFYAQEYRPTLGGGVTVNARVPTMLERQGDFSQSVDTSGSKLIGPIYNPFSGLAKSQCTATNSAACFPGGVIPAGQLYGPGLAILNSYPVPNVAFGSQANAAVNFVTVTPVLHQLSYLPTFRSDYQASPALRISGKWTGTGARIVPNPGNFPGYTDVVQNFPWVFDTSGTVNYSMNSSTFLEVTYGMTQNRLGSPGTSAYTNRSNVTCAAENAGTLPLGVTGAGAALANVPNCSEGNLPYPLTDSIAFNPGFYETKAIQTVGSPFLVSSNGQILSMLPPQINYGTNNNFIPSSGVTAPPSLAYPSFMNINRNQNLAASVTKVMARHTIKTGFFIDHSFKAQNQGPSNAAAQTFQGIISFATDSNNPFDTNFPLSNVATGVFQNYTQQNKFVEGSFHYTSVESYVQDNWKINRKLTLDYGLRFVHQGPQADQFLQDSNFFPDQWSIANAPKLYLPGCAVVSPCSGTNRQALNPVNGLLLGPGTANLIGLAVPNSGDFSNGVVQAGNGIASTAYTWPAMVYAPRFGAAYDVSGTQRLVVRGSVGLFYDRPDGNTVFSTISNPYAGGPVSTTVQFGTLSTLGQGPGPVSKVQVFQYDGKIPSDVQWNVGAQLALPWSASLGVAYVGHHGYNLASNTGNATVNTVDLNGIDLGTGLVASGQDPTNGTIPTGLTAAPLPDNILRPLRGYTNVFVSDMEFDRTFHSIQSDFTRRFRGGFSFGVNWTLSLKDTGTVNMPAGNPQLRFIHAADGSISLAPTNAQAQALFADQGITRNVVQTNFVYALPSVHGGSGAVKDLALVFSDWQLSGILRLDSGAPYDVAFQYGSGGTSNTTNLTGSPDYAGRIIINNLSALGSGCSSNQYQQITNAFISNSTVLSPSTAVQGPAVGSNGLESGRNLLHACGNHTLDLSLSRTIRLGGGRQFQIRADAFNAPNSVIFNARNATININNVNGQTVTNGIFLADGTVDPTKTKPNATNAFGVATGALAPRTMQVQIRFQF